MLLEVASAHALDAIEGVIRRAAHHHDASVLAIVPVGQLVREKTTQDAIVFAICQPELYAALLEADIRTAAFLPWRIAACSDGGQVTLRAVSPLECCRDSPPSTARPPGAGALPGGTTSAAAACRAG